MRPCTFSKQTSLYVQLLSWAVAGGLGYYWFVLPDQRSRQAHQVRENSGQESLVFLAYGEEPPNFITQSSSSGFSEGFQEDLFEG